MDLSRGKSGLDTARVRNGFFQRSGTISKCCILPSPNSWSRARLPTNWRRSIQGREFLSENSRTTSFIASRGSRGVVRSGWRAFAKNLRIASGSAHKQETRRAAKNSLSAAQ